ncbi:hypothetical protein DYE49_05295 [Treponema rectale]|uniref:Uncharacterized protein n=1 Tax=Treponema rectale TaxID=744512 RepID=A0A840SDZ6_9SPIR|nr:hypothetical protein [Treponema rectale]MBB5218408.1 hypothetical protein [Treponema rectale]QOS39900.1 hypothetical protein DYE49_05295 [Treponema rectale]
MTLTEFDQEEYDRNRREEGKNEKAREIARNFLVMKVLTPEQIAQATGLKLNEVLNIKYTQE